MGLAAELIFILFLSEAEIKAPYRRILLKVFYCLADKYEARRISPVL